MLIEGKEKKDASSNLTHADDHLFSTTLTCTFYTLVGLFS